MTKFKKAAEPQPTDLQPSTKSDVIHAEQVDQLTTEHPQKVASEPAKLEAQVRAPNEIDKQRQPCRLISVSPRCRKSTTNSQTRIQLNRTITDQTKAAGFRWEPRAQVNDKQGAWVQTLEQGREIRTMLDSENLFKSLGNQIRLAKGLEPVGMHGR